MLIADERDKLNSFAIATSGATGSVVAAQKVACDRVRFRLRAAAATSARLSVHPARRSRFSHHASNKSHAWFTRCAGSALAADLDVMTVAPTYPDGIDNAGRSSRKDVDTCAGTVVCSENVNMFASVGAGLSPDARRNIGPANLFGSPWNCVSRVMCPLRDEFYGYGHPLPK
jgi:hypothetical protein